MAQATAMRKYQSWVQQQTAVTGRAPSESERRRMLRTFLEAEQISQFRSQELGLRTEAAETQKEQFGQTFAQRELEFGVSAGLVREQIEAQESAATISGIGTLLSGGALLSDVLFSEGEGGGTLAGKISSYFSSGGAETIETVPTQASFEAVSSAAVPAVAAVAPTAFGAAAPSVGAMAVPSQASFAAVSSATAPTAATGTTAVSGGTLTGSAALGAVGTAAAGLGVGAVVYDQILKSLGVSGGLLGHGESEAPSADEYNDYFNKGIYTQTMAKFFTREQLEAIKNSPQMESINLLIESAFKKSEFRQFEGNIGRTGGEVSGPSTESLLALTTPSIGNLFKPKATTQEINRALEVISSGEGNVAAAQELLGTTNRFSVGS